MGDLDYNVIDIFLRCAEGARKILLKMVFSKVKTLGKGVQNRKIFAPGAGQKIANTSWDYGLDLEPQKTPPLLRAILTTRGGFITSIRTDAKSKSNDAGSLLLQIQFVLIQNYRFGK